MHAGDATYVLKVSRPEADHAELALQQAVLRHLQLHPGRLETPRVLEALNGVDLLEVSDGVARLLTYLDGAPYAGATLTLEQARQLGAGMGDMVTRLRGFRHPAARRYHPWNPMNTLDTVAALRHHIDTPHRSSVLEAAVAYLTPVEPTLVDLPQQLIHSDANDLNVIVRDEVVTGLIDFSDTIHSVRVAELAIACAYAMLDAIDPVSIAAAVVTGWRTTSELTDPEAAALLPLIVARLATSVSVLISLMTRARGAWSK